MSAALSLTRWATTTLRATPAVTDIIPATAIFDVNLRPEIIPCIRLGEGQEVPVDVVGRYLKTYLDAHIWTPQTRGLGMAKIIASVVKNALQRPFVRTDLSYPAGTDSTTGFPYPASNFIAMDIQFVSSRYLRDPDPEYGHAVLTLAATMVEGN